MKRTGYLTVFGSFPERFGVNRGVTNREKVLKRGILGYLPNT